MNYPWWKFASTPINRSGKGRRRQSSGCTILGGLNSDNGKRHSSGEEKGLGPSFGVYLKLLAIFSASELNCHALIASSVNRIVQISSDCFSENSHQGFHLKIDIIFNLHLFHQCKRYLRFVQWFIYFSCYMVGSFISCPLVSKPYNS